MHQTPSPNKKKAQPIKNFNLKIKYLFFDIDDTITTKGKLPSTTYNFLWKLHQVGIKLFPVTGRPAGWCEMIARFWPVEAVIGENGAFYFQYKNKKMNRFFLSNKNSINKNQVKLKKIQNEILKQVPGSAISSDQFCRLFDLAIDFCEDVKPLKKNQVKLIKDIFLKHGANAKISSIHVNGWFGSYDKLSAVKALNKNLLKESLKNFQKHSAFIGDSPNDEPLFGYFDNSIGVKNIYDFLDDLEHPPKFICSKNNSEGFNEFSKLCLQKVPSYFG